MDVKIGKTANCGPRPEDLWPQSTNFVPAQITSQRVQLEIYPPQCSQDTEEHIWCENEGNRRRLLFPLYGNRQLSRDMCFKMLS
jgi:hypothetical protein